MFIMGGFTGHGMPQVFLTAKAIGLMVLGDLAYSDTGLPRLFQESQVRLESKENFLRDMADSEPSLARI